MEIPALGNLFLSADNTGIAPVASPTDTA